MTVKAWWDGLFGRIKSRGSALNISGAVDFKSPFTASSNTATGEVEVEIDSSDLGNLVADATVENATALRSIAIVSDRILRTRGYASAGDGGGGLWLGVTGASAATYTHNGGTVIVPSGGDGSAAWVRVISNNSVMGTWFGMIGGADSPANDALAAANVAAFDAAISACRAEGYEFKFPPGYISVDSTLEFAGLSGMIVSGSGCSVADSSGKNHSTIKWVGGTSGPIVEFNGCRDMVLRSFRVSANSSYPAEIGIRFYWDGTGEVITYNVGEDFEVQGNGGYIGDCVRLEKDGAASDANNSELSLIRPRLKGYGTGGGLFTNPSGLKNLQGQSKVLYFEKPSLIASATGSYGIYSHGSFYVDGGGGGENQVADFYVTNPNDATTIVGFTSEQSAALLVTGGPSSAAGPCTLLSCRFNGLYMSDPYWAIDYRFGGTLTVQGCTFQNADDQPMRFRVGNNSASCLTHRFVGNAIQSSEFPIVYNGAREFCRVLFEGNTRVFDDGSAATWPDLKPPENFEEDWSPYLYLIAGKETYIDTNGVSRCQELYRRINFNANSAGESPALSRRDSDFGGHDALVFASDGLVSDVTSWPLADQKFLHDGTVDWEIIMTVVVQTAAGAGEVLLGNGTAFSTTTGLFVSLGSSEKLEARISNAGTVTAYAITANSSVTRDQTHLVRIKFTASSGTLSIQIDQDSPGTAVAASGFDTGNSAHPLRIGRNGAGANIAGMKLGSFFLSKSIAGAVLKEHQESYYAMKNNIPAADPPL